MGLGALLGLTTIVACGRAADQRSAPETTAVGKAAVTAGRGAPSDPPGAAAKAGGDSDPVPVAEAIEPPTLPEGALAAWQPPPGEPAELTEIKRSILNGDASVRTVKTLQKLTHKYPKNEELPYLLGQLYFTKLWVGDGLKAFRSALQLDPSYRANPFLLRAAISGLGNDSDYSQVRRFLIQDVGRPAAPYLEEVLYGDWRPQVKERAAAVLREVQ